MPTKGTYSALNQLRPLENNLQGILNDARRQDNIDRQQDRIDDNAKKREKEARQTSKINAYDKLKSQKTGYSSIDEGIADYIENKLVTKLDEAYAILEKDPDNFRAKLEIDRITKQPEQLKLLSQALVDRKKDFEEGVASGKYSKTLNKGKLEAFDKLFNDYNFALDYADGKTQLFIDVDGDGINDAEGEGITLGNMFEADKLGEFTPGFSLESYVTKAKDKLSTSDIGIQTGLSTERNKGVNETSVSVLETDMNDRFGTSVETMTTAFKSLVQDNLGLELPTTDEEMTAIKDKIKDKITSQVDTEKEVSYDQKTALDIKKFNKKEEESKATLGEGVTPTETTWGRNFKKIPYNALAVPVKNTKLSAITVKEGGKVKKLSNANVDTYTVDEDNNIVVEVSYAKEKSRTIKKSELTRLRELANDGDENAINLLTNGSVVNEEGDNITITYPGKNERSTFTVTNETASEIAEQQGITVDELKSRAKKKSEETSEETKPLTAEEIRAKYGTE